MTGVDGGRSFTGCTVRGNTAILRRRPGYPGSYPHRHDRRRQLAGRRRSQRHRRSWMPAAVYGTHRPVRHRRLGRAPPAATTGLSSSPLSLLAPLANNGGPTETMALLPGQRRHRRRHRRGRYHDRPARGASRFAWSISAAVQSSLVVESTAGAVDTTAAGLTLPGAISLANQFAGVSITFDPVVFATDQTIS